MKHQIFSTALVGLIFSGPVSAKATSTPNKILIKFSEKVDSSEALMRIENFSLSNHARFLGHTQLSALKQKGWGVLRFSTNLEALTAAKLLRKEPGVEWAQPDYLMRVLPVGSTNLLSRDPLMALRLDPFNIPDPQIPLVPELPLNPIQDPEFSKLWGMVKIEADKSWIQQKGSRAIVVADIDTGIDYTHPDLINNLWVNPDPARPDVVGYDFANDDPLPYDDQSHGTHTAGTIGATGFNGLGIVGVSPAVSVMGIKFITSEGSGTTEDAIDSIDYAIANGARVMSNSWGGEADEGEENKLLIEAVERAEAANILFVAAAGNDGSDNDAKPVYPAAIERSNVLTVASTNERDARSFFSNYGLRTVHVAAPGSNVYSTIPGGKYAQFSGTSMACPHVAGLAALILAENAGLTAVQVKEIIMSTVDPIPTLTGKIVTGGRINARNALSRARSFGI
jgi:thermitase